MKSLTKNRKLVVILAISFFFLLNIFAMTNVLAKDIQEDTVFNLDKEDDLGPEGYGAIVPSPNTAGALYVDGSNQGKFKVTNWLGGGPVIEEIVNNPGEDISLYYPTDLDGHWTGAVSPTDDIDPWSDVDWLNVSAYNAEAETLSPFTVSTVFDYYAMKEGGVFTKPFNFDHPMQIDLIVTSTGPKVLKIDWLTVGSVNYDYLLVSPSGKPVDGYVEDADFMGINVLYEYLIFSASEIGAYRLIIGVTGYSNPASLNLEFLDIDISSLPLNTIKFAGNFDDFATLDISKTAMWQSNWYKFTGKKGEIFKLDIYEDFTSGPHVPNIDVWIPCANGYFYDPIFTMGSHNIYFARSGAAYISFTDVWFEDWYRYSLYVSKANNELYTLGDTTTFSISLDQPTTVQFSVQEDSIVRFNYTSLPHPPGAPFLSTLGTGNPSFYFRDSNEYMCYDINSPIFSQSVDSMDFYWYYMPAGTYKGIIQNFNDDENGLFKISSQVYPYSEETIPVNSMTYPSTHPSEFGSIEFEQDPEHISLKNPKIIEIEIPEIGQFRLNTTIFASDHDITSGFPSYLYTLNKSDSNFYTSDYPYPAFSTDGSDTEVDDYLYIGAPTRWTGMTFDFTTLGTDGSIDDPLVYTGFTWGTITMDSDDTTGFTADGTIELDISDAAFDNWVKGADDDLDPDIDESDYYWMAIRCFGDYTIVPIIQQLTLLNLTIAGNLQFTLIGETGYQYDDYWGPTGIAQPSLPSYIELSLDNDDGGPFTVDTSTSNIIRSGDPLTIGFEPGIYRLLIIPEDWDYNGTVTINFAVENYWDYAHHATYDIGNLTPIPNLHARDIHNYTLSGYSNFTGSVYPYGLVTEYNHTESMLPYGGSQSYFVLECLGEPYQWTQLVARLEGLGTGEYNLYILQDLPWIGTMGPNNEWNSIASFVDYNATFEFGVFSDSFLLLFEVDSSLENVTFYLSLSQYDTLLLTTSDLKKSYTPPLPPALILALVIGIPAAAVAVIIVYVLKKKGKILTKRPT